MFNKNKLIKIMEDKNFSMYKLWKKSGVAQSTLSNLLNKENVNPSSSTLVKIATALDVSVNDFLDVTDAVQSNEEALEKSNLSEKDEKDIEKDLSNALKKLEHSQEGLMFSGEPLDDETRELLKISLENSMRLAKQIAKNKFTPKKYK